MGDGYLIGQHNQLRLHYNQILKYHPSFPTKKKQFLVHLVGIYNIISHFFLVAAGVEI